MRSLFLPTLAMLYALVVAAHSLVAAPPPPAASADQIAAWIRELDADQFAVRETASAALVQAGGPAIEPVSAALPGASREVKFRVVFVLRELALSTDLDVEDAARMALEKIAASADAVASRRAEASLSTLNEIRLTRTVEELERLGAKFDASRGFNGVFLAEVVSSVEIGPDWRGEEKDLRRLKWLANVQQVVFTGPRVTDGWLQHVAGMQNLTWISVRRASITDAALKSLVDLPRLSILELKYVPVGDGAVESLAKLKTARTLRIFGTDMTVAGADKLKAALAAAKIDYRRGGFLGVGGSQFSPIGCEISRVTENSAAANAGLQEGDVILRYEGKAVEGFEKLTELIAVNRGGDTITLDVARNLQMTQRRESHDKTVVLGITGKATVMGCELTAVAEGSFAAQHNLKVGDVVVRYKRERIYDPERLRTLFAEADPNDEQEIEYVRGAQLLTVKATLGEWE